MWLWRWWWMILVLVKGDRGWFFQPLNEGNVYLVYTVSGIYCEGGDVLYIGFNQHIVDGRYPANHHQKDVSNLVNDRIHIHIHIYIYHINWLAGFWNHQQYFSFETSSSNVSSSNWVNFGLSCDSRFSFLDDFWAAGSKNKHPYELELWVPTWMTQEVSKWLEKGL